MWWAIIEIGVSLFYSLQSTFFNYLDDAYYKRMPINDYLFITSLTDAFGYVTAYKISTIRKS